MRLYSTGGRFSYRNLLLSVLLFTVIICLFVFSLQNTSTSARSESRQVTEAAIERALVTCYAVEGMYPASVEYLEEHYGVLMITADMWSTTAPRGQPQAYVQLIDIGSQ